MNKQIEDGICVLLVQLNVVVVVAVNNFHLIKRKVSNTCMKNFKLKNMIT